MLFSYICKSSLSFMSFRNTDFKRITFVIPNVMLDFSPRNEYFTIEN